jgi:hypothetical protein
VRTAAIVVNADGITTLKNSRRSGIMPMSKVTREAQRILDWYHFLVVIILILQLGRFYTCLYDLNWSPWQISQVCQGVFVPGWVIWWIKGEGFPGIHPEIHMINEEIALSLRSSQRH